MLVNFLHPVFNPVIECDTISSEGFDACNLISADVTRSQNGFLAERFISGPVTFDVKFTCQISLRKVIIWSKVGCQKSTGFELSSYESTSSESKRFACGTISVDADGVVFLKEGWTDNLQHSIETKFFERKTFFRNKCYENIRSMRIKIFKSHFVPAVKKIEIWGECSRLCNKEMKRRIVKLWSEKDKHYRVDKPDSIPISNFEENSVSHDELIPDEFFDELTHEVMTLPMILPSGKIIDNRTLEKFEIEEARWGRLPSDPFTGLPFTMHKKPVVSASLKAKIDSFFFKNSNLEEIKLLPRRLGSENESLARDTQISKLINNNKNILTVETKEDASPLQKRRRVIDHDIFSKNKDVDSLLDETLNNLPSYLHKSKNDSSSEASTCRKCSINDNLYRLPCSHMYCRICLLKNENGCILCCKKFFVGEVCKVHITKWHDTL